MTRLPSEERAVRHPPLSHQWHVSLQRDGRAVRHPPLSETRLPPEERAVRHSPLSHQRHVSLQRIDGRAVWHSPLSHQWHVSLQSDIPLSLISDTSLFRRETGAQRPADDLFEDLFVQCQRCVWFVNQHTVNIRHRTCLPMGTRLAEPLPLVQQPSQSKGAKTRDDL